MLATLSPFNTLPKVKFPDDRLYRLLGIPLLAVIFAYILHGQYPAISLLELFLRSLLFCSVIWEGNRAIFFWLRKRYPGFVFTRQRTLMQSGLSLVYTVAASWVISYALKWVFTSIVWTPYAFLVCSLISLIPTLLCLSIYEAVYFWISWKVDFMRQQELARENITAQFEALKHQVDPHFLFNSLNTLSSLIGEDKPDAQRYLLQLSDIYRYVLLSRDRMTVSLAEELAFLEAYVALNKIRFRDQLNFSHQFTPAMLSQHIAPLSLQLLVENALKHNVLSAESPLKIKLYGEGDYVVVENNLQVKTTLEKSTRTGLQNIVQRFKLLVPQRQVVVHHTAQLFQVRLPLIAQPRV